MWPQLVSEIVSVVAVHQPAIEPASPGRERACPFQMRRPGAAQSSPCQLIQPRSWNLMLSCFAIASGVALALTSCVFLPLASMDSDPPPHLRLRATRASFVKCAGLRALPTQEGLSRWQVHSCSR